MNECKPEAWHVSDTHPDIIEDDFGIRICCLMNMTPNQIKKNACLIAASKELLSVAQSLCAWSEKYPSNRIYSHHEISIIAKKLDAINDMAKDAIAKALGNQTTKERN